MKNSFKLLRIRAPLFMLLSLWILLFLQNVFNYWPGSSISVYNFSFLQNIILFWLIGNDIIRNPLLFEKVSLSLIFGVILSGILVVLGYGLGTGDSDSLGINRLYFFGMDPNYLAYFIAIALILSVFIIFNSKNIFGKKIFLLLFSFPLLFSLLSYTGSRGGLLVAFLGLIILFSFQKTNFKSKLFYIIFGGLFIVFVGLKVLHTDVIKNRFQDSIGIESLGGRKNIWSMALDVFYEKPFFGVGFTGYEKIMINNLKVVMDTHNIFLYFMVTGGIVALIVYLVFLYELTNRSYNYYKYNNEVILFVLLFVYLAIVVQVGSAIDLKLTWILTALIFGKGMSNKSIKSNFT